jgi:hypothetical protein
VGRLTSRSALLAWGSTSGRDTIGRGSPSAGQAEVTIDGRPVTVDPARNWVEIPLAPDTRYQYRVTLGGNPIGEGAFRTYPEQADRLTFLVLGDFGTGGAPQAAVANAMAGRLDDQEKAGDPVRFILTTGDNIYGKRFLFWRTSTGNSDRHWESRFFAPYARVLRSVPFYPSPGNHDGSESERTGDLPVYLDNFFFPGEVRAGGRYYRFSFGSLAEFFALDTNKNLPALSIAPGSEQFQWVEQSLKASTARWKIPYYHHPRYCGGPGHGSRPDLDPLVRLFERYSLSVAFNGHEHNWQPIEEKLASGRLLYHVITGAGGELRRSRPGTTSFDNGKARVAEWIAARHFTLVQIDGPKMTITPIGADNKPVGKALVVTAP